MLKPGQQFGKLIITTTPPVIVVSGGCSKRKYEVYCDPAIGGCGSPPKWVVGTSLTRGYTQSCGKCSKAGGKTHGHTYINGKLSPLYCVWSAMKQRCHNPKNAEYHNYGARGITVCQDWFYSFESFYNWSLSAGYQKGLELDRFPDGDNGYCPNNCRWAARESQANNINTNVLITAFGETKTRSRWVRDSRCNVSYMTLKRRIGEGWDPERAITSPP